MRRTQTRPLPAGAAQRGEGTWFGVVVSAIGLAELAFAVNVMSASVAAATLISYVLVYTPLKPRTSLSTLVGAFRAPATGHRLDRRDGTDFASALVLFGIVFFWQMPHFLAIAWLYRDDYARAGIPLLPVLEPDGRRTGQQR